MEAPQIKQNFCLPLNLDRLQNERLRLIPIESCTDANLEEYINETCIKHPDLWTFFPIGPHDSVKAYKTWYNKAMRDNPACIIFAIYLKPGKVTKGDEEFEVSDNTFAGTIGLINATAENSSVEVGHVMVLPRFHRTFVNSVACCLLAKHLLDPISGGDLQMRRVQWQAYSVNERSVKAAQRLGFTLEGIIRWQRIIGDNKMCIGDMSGETSKGKPVVDIEGRKLGPGRHSAMLSLCWDDWLDGKRDHVMTLLARA